MAKNEKERVDTLERGDIFFFYRPRIEEESPEGKKDVQRFYMVLSPDGKKRHRLIILGRKQMPDPGKSGRGRFWGFVDLVRKNPDSIRKELEGESYGTKTRGERHLPSARPAGEGVYRILRHGNHTHLVYALELPESPGEVQEDLRIEEEASYVVSIKNPEKPSPPSAGLSEKREADFPKRLKEIFRGRKFADADPPDFLDHEGAELLLIAASEDIEEELGIRLNTDDESETSADVFRELHVDRKKRPVEPLFEGRWE